MHQELEITILVSHILCRLQEFLGILRMNCKMVSLRCGQITLTSLKPSFLID